MEEFEYLSAVERQGDINPVQRTRLEELKRQYGAGAGFAGGAFSFDYEAAAKAAYGELGTYYDRILRESQGDLNKALARLLEDYNRGVRFKEEDVKIGGERIDYAERLAKKRIIDSALARGLYQKSPGEPSGGFGIPDVEFADLATRTGFQRGDIARGLARFKETAGVQKGRQEVDLPEKQVRYAADLERTRRLEAAELASLRGSQAYTKYQSQLF